MKKKILDVRMPVEDQLASKKLEEKLREKKWKFTVKMKDGKVRYVYSSDKESTEAYLRLVGATILKVENMN